MVSENDIDQLPLLTADTILELLSDRYANDEIYTWACTTLVAVNPYKELEQLYYQIAQQKFSDTLSSDSPHIYSIAESAINIIKQSYSRKCDASIIVSGESGAGKTENTKHLLRYLTVVRSQHNYSSKREQAQRIEDHILSFSPMLESFGNACTSCNDNSSRFGKYIVLQYDEDQVIVGAHIQTYLLEKTRVVHQSTGNSNFHIFYQFLDGLSDEERGKYLISDTTSYNYALTRSPPEAGCKTRTWNKTLLAWQAAGFSEKDKDHICATLGAILCLGNIEIVQNSTDDTIKIKDTSDAFMDKVSNLLGIERRSLEQTLLYRRISASHARRRSIFHKPCSLSESVSRRDCVAKFLYDRLFLWLVGKINSHIKCDEYSSFIGLLDIYGFESFSENSLEQLCINYANERLQLYFVHHYLRDLQAEYTEEIIPWQHVNMTSDNESCVRLMSDNPGIFSLLNEECQLNRLEAQDNISERLSSSLSAHSNLVSTQKDVMKKTFTIKHYAHPVLYRTEALVDKNKDAVPEDIIALLSESEKHFITGLTDGCHNPQRGKQHKKTVLSKFKHSLDELLVLLSSTECQYVRCIKPNKLAQAGAFNKQYVDKQLKACGVMETVKIRCQAHAVRMKYEDFFSLYSVLHSRQSQFKLADKENDLGVTSTPLTPRQRRRTLLPVADINQSPSIFISDSGIQNKQTTPVKSHAKRSVTSLLRHLLGPSMSKSVNFGTTKLFIKSQETLDYLESEKKKKLSSSAFTIQCLWRKYSTIKNKQIQNHAASVITRAVRQCRDRLVKRRTEVHRLAESKLSTGDDDPLRNVTVRRRKAIHIEVKDYGDKVQLWSGSPHIQDDVTSQISQIHRNNIHRKNGIISIRHISNTRVIFHVKMSSMLRYSHIYSQSHVSHSLLDCLEDREKYIRSGF